MFRTVIFAILIAIGLSACGKSESDLRAEAAAEKASAVEAAKTELLAQQAESAQNATPMEVSAPVVEAKVLEDNRRQARANATKFANTFVNEDPVTYDGYKVVPNGDSSQQPTCPQGDGWATIKLVKAGATALQLKCSTISAGIGCLTTEDFDKKDVYKSQDGHCQPTTVIPFPIPKQ